MIVDDYAGYLLEANLKAGTKGLPGLLGRIGLSQPAGVAMLAAANAIALTALVVFDPADLRSRETRSGRPASQRLQDPEVQEFVAELRAGINQEGMVKNAEGFIEIV